MHHNWNQWWYGRGVSAVRPATCGETSPEAAGELWTYGGLDTDQALFRGHQIDRTMRGTRKPWKSSTQDRHTDDFGLLAHVAGLRGGE